MAIVAALAGFVVFWLTVHFGNKIAHRWLRYGAMLGGIILGIGLVGAMARSVEESVLAGQILAGLIIAYAILKSLFSRGK